MNLWLTVPTAVLSVASVLAGPVTGRFHPAASVRVLGILTSSAAASTFAWLVLAAGDLVLHVGPDRFRHLAIGRVVAAHETAPRWMALGAALWLLVVVVRMAAALRARRSVRALLPDGSGVLYADLDGFVGLAIPGRRGRIVLSRPALATSTAAERSVVVAHEWAHLRDHHGCFRMAVELAALLCPWLRSAERRTVFLLERWADERAAADVGDRTLVARTIARLALAAQATPISTMAFERNATAARARAMLLPPPTSRRFAEPVTLVGTALAAGVLVTDALQLHHAVRLL